MTLLNITPGTPVRYKLTFTDALEGKWREAKFRQVAREGGDSYLPKVNITGLGVSVFADRIQVQNDAGKWVNIWTPDADENAATPSGPVSEFYNTPCPCGAQIPRTGRRGRPPTKCEECR